MTPAPLSILIVDDQPSVVAALEAVLRELFPEAELLTAGSAEEAWELIQRHRPAIVLCDIVLPGETSGLGTMPAHQGYPGARLHLCHPHDRVRDCRVARSCPLPIPSRRLPAQALPHCRIAGEARSGIPRASIPTAAAAGHRTYSLRRAAPAPANTAGDPLTGAAAALHTAPPLLPMAGRPCRRTGGAGTGCCSRMRARCTRSVGLHCRIPCSTSR
jgi:hypothetical protein